MIALNIFALTVKIIIAIGNHTPKQREDLTSPGKEPIMEMIFTARKGYSQKRSVNEVMNDACH